jgi:hypothetical protein
MESEVLALRVDRRRKKGTATSMKSMNLQIGILRSDHNTTVTYFDETGLGEIREQTVFIIHC